MSELCDLQAVELRRLIGAKTISPVELLESCLRRIERTNPAVNAIVATCVDRARKEARAAEDAVMRGDALPALHGLPIGIKDLNETEGLRTTWGSPLFADHVPTEDERVVAAIRRAGAIVVGKTNTPEFGAGANTVNPVYGPTGNPFDPTLTCGGSSGGSAVALATSMLPLCHGSDTGGSLRIPASFCGVVGFRPSPGVVPSEKRPLGWTPISVQGPMGRNVADTSLLMSALAGDDASDPLSGPIDAAAFARPMEIDLSRLKVALSDDLGVAVVDKRIRAAFKDKTALFRSAFGRCENRAPDMSGVDDAFDVMRAVSFLAQHRERFEKSRDRLGPNIVANVEDGLKMSAGDVARAHAAQTRIYRGCIGFFAEFDVLIAPTVAVPPFPWTQRYVEEIDGRKLRNYFHWLCPTYALTVATLPCASIPCGLDSTGMPFGIQIAGPPRSDRFVLGVAHALERLMAGDARTARPVPDLVKLDGRRI